MFCLMVHTPQPCPWHVGRFLPSWCRALPCQTLNATWASRMPSVAFWLLVRHPLVYMPVFGQAHVVMVRIETCYFSSPSTCMHASGPLVTMFAHCLAFRAGIPSRMGSRHKDGAVEVP